jgi:tetratricopeptide (TPR) repeat protein
MGALAALATPLRCVLEYRLTEAIVALLVTLVGGGFVLFRDMLPEDVRSSAQSAYRGVAAGLVLGILVAIALPKIAEGSCRAIIGTGAQQAFSPAADGETLLIIVPFAGRLNDVSAFPERYARDALAQRVARLRLADRPTRLEMWTTPVVTQREAREIGSSYGATLVVWGEFDDVGGVRTFIEVMRDVPQADIELAGNWLALGTLTAGQTEVGKVTRDCLLKAMPAQADSLATVALGMIEIVDRRPDAAEQLFTQAIDAAPAALECGAEISAAYGWRGFARSLQEHYPAALDDLNQALALHKDNPLTQAQRGIVQLAIGRGDEAKADFQAALAVIDPEDKASRATLLGNIGLTHELRGDLDGALQFYQQADQLTQERGDQFAQALSAGHLGSLFLRKGDLGQSRRYYTQGRDLCRAVGYKQGEAVAIGNLGLVDYRSGDLDAAVERFDEALAINVAIGSPTGQGQQLLRVGAIQIERQQVSSARASFQRALELFEGGGSLAGQGRAYIGLALAEQQQGDAAKATAALQQALTLLEQIGSPDAAQVRQQFQRIQP